MKMLRAKLKSRAGESLAEVLIALLVSALALVMLASMIAHAFNMITTSRDKMNAYYGQSALSSPPAASADPITAGPATVGVQIGDDELADYAVQYARYDKLGETIISYVPGAPVAGG